MSASPGRAMDGYPVPPATMTDLYELTMAAAYRRAASVTSSR